MERDTKLVVLLTDINKLWNTSFNLPKWEKIPEEEKYLMIVQL
jgi:hypothetical protein